MNDGSTDSSLKIVEKYSCDAIKILSQDNAGASAARNTGLKLSLGEYIQFLDADDIISSNKLEVQIALLKENPGKICYCPTVHFFDGEDFLNAL